MMLGKAVLQPGMKKQGNQCQISVMLIGSTKSILTVKVMTLLFFDTEETKASDISDSIVEDIRK